MALDKIQSVPFSALPGHSRLFIDYVSSHEKTLRYYNGDPFSEDTWRRRFSKPVTSKVDRTVLVNILMKQNSRWGNGEAVSKNITRLGSPETRAVVTGQQVGILGGPMYTIFKAVTAIRLAHELDQKGIPCVPVFWMETNDHDFQEIRRVGYLNYNSEPVQINYEDQNVVKRTPVGDIPLSENIGIFFDRIRSAIRETEFTGQVLSYAREAYHPGRTFGDAFACFMSRLFSAFGLILFDPSESDVSKAAREYYHLVIDNGPLITKAVDDVSRDLLQAGYHVQARLPEETAHLFYIHLGKRCLLKRNGSWKFGETEASVDEIMNRMETEPERFSPTVLTRPLLQDFLFPTIGYIAGPGEIAYWAQIKPLYDIMNMTMPVIYPRASGTLLESRMNILLGSYNLSPAFVLSNPVEAACHVLQGITHGESETTLDEFHKDLKTYRSQLTRVMTEVDATLRGSVDTMYQKIDYQINKLRQKYNKALERKHKTTTEQIRRITEFILPRGKLQEREINICYFLMRHGMGLIPRLVSDIPLDTGRHFIYFL